MLVRVMARRPAIFKQNDVVRALRATTAAGIAVSRIEIDRAGKIVIVTGAGDIGNDLDRELAEFGARHDQDRA